MKKEKELYADFYEFQKTYNSKTFFENIKTIMSELYDLIQNYKNFDINIDKKDNEVVIDVEFKDYDDEDEIHTHKFNDLFAPLYENR